MGLQYFSGFEDGTLLGGTVLGGVANAATNPRSGARHLAMLAASDEFQIGFPADLAASTDDVIVGAAMYAESFQSQGLMLVKFGAVTGHITLGFNTGGTVEVGRVASAASAPTNLDTSAGSVISLSTWHYVEMRCRFSNTVGQIEVFVDGTQVIDATGLDTIQSGSGELGRTLILRAPNTSVNLLADDVYLLDPTGESTPYDTFLGPLEIERLVPTSDSAVASWTTTGGNHFGEIDEVPVVDTDNIATTSMVQALFGCGNRTHTGSTILGVKPHAIAKLASGVGAKDLAPHIRTDVGGSPSDSPKTGSALAGGDTEVFNIETVDPDTAAAWTGSAIDAAELGLEVV